MHFILKTYSRRTKERFCGAHPESASIVGETTWGTLKLDECYEGSSDPIVIHRCFTCLQTMCGFTPMWGRVLKQNHSCENCGRTGKVIKFMTSIPYPGSRKLICVECFKEAGVVVVETKGLVGAVVIDQGQRGL
jgi:hypothetical protein